jgi:hypothetical protein
MYTLMESAKLNDIDPPRLARRRPRPPVGPHRKPHHELLPWHWQNPEPISAAA